MNITKTRATVGATAIAALIAVTTVAHARNANYTELQGANTDIGTAIALATAAAPGQVMEAELEVEDGQLVWEIKVLGEDMTRTKLELDGNTGEILEQKSKQKKRKRKAGRDSVEVIGIEQALEIASAETDGLVIEAELERKRGKAVWEIETVGSDNDKREIHIDATTGELL